jgi:hypothetical protein
LLVPLDPAEGDELPAGSPLRLATESSLSQAFTAMAAAAKTTTGRTFLFIDYSLSAFLISISAIERRKLDASQSSCFPFCLDAVQLICVSKTIDYQVYCPALATAAKMLGA